MIALVAAIVFQVAPAAVVYRCPGADGIQTYQLEPCVGGTVLAKGVSTTADSEPHVSAFISAAKDGLGLQVPRTFRAATIDENEQRATRARAKAPEVKYATPEYAFVERGKPAWEGAYFLIQVRRDLARPTADQLRALVKTFQTDERQRANKAVSEKFKEASLTMEMQPGAAYDAQRNVLQMTTLAIYEGRPYAQYQEVVPTSYGAVYLLGTMPNSTVEGVQGLYRPVFETLTLEPSVR